MDDTLECLKSITEGSFLNLLKKINGYRDTDSDYSIKEVIYVIRKASIITCDINACDMLPGNPSLKDDHPEYLQTQCQVSWKATNQNPPSMSVRC